MKIKVKIAGQLPRSRSQGRNVGIQSNKKHSYTHLNNNKTAEH